VNCVVHSAEHRWLARLRHVFRASIRGMAGATSLAALRAAARECQLAAPSFTDEQAAQGLTITVGLRASFLPPSSSAQAAFPLLQLPA